MLNQRQVDKVIDSFISVRKAIALMITLVFCFLAIQGRVKSEEFIPVFSMIVGYYFGKSTALDVPGKNTKSECD